MINEKLKRMAIVFLIVVFSVAGIVACSADATAPSSSTELPAPTEPEPTPTFPGNTYMTVYTPWRGENYPRVSYLDTNNLLRYWKEMISIKYKGNTKRWRIKSEKDGGNYYYFDKNFDLVYYRQGKGTLKIRKLVGATAMKYYSGKSAGTLAIAGIYKNLIDNAGKYNWTDFSRFMHAGYNAGGHNNGRREAGDLELMLLNIGMQNSAFTQFGVDSYYNTWNSYRKDINKYLGQSPEALESSDKYAGKLRLNVNERLNLGYHGFWFVEATPGDWESEEHPEGDWVSR